jgi:beta-lactam-binding protein with PASTA domain
VLQAQGFTVATVKRPTASSSPGTVLAQSPASGDAPHGSTVTLTVATALPNVTVPNLLGSSEVAADQALAKLGLIPIPIIVSKSVNPQYDHKVLFQSPAAQSSVPPQTQVTIHIEQYQAPTQPTGPTGPTGSTSTSSTTTSSTTTSGAATTGASGATGAT